MNGIVGHCVLSHSTEIQFQGASRGKSQGAKSVLHGEQTVGWKGGWEGEKLKISEEARRLHQNTGLQYHPGSWKPACLQQLKCPLWALLMQRTKESSLTYCRWFTDRNTSLLCQVLWFPPWWYPPPKYEDFYLQVPWKATIVPHVKAHFGGVIIDHTRWLNEDELPWSRRPAPKTPWGLRGHLVWVYSRCSGCHL